MVRRVECMLGKKVHRQKRFSERERERERCLVLEGKEEAARRENFVYRRTADGEENCEFLAPDVHQTGEKRRLCKKLHSQKRFLERERERERE
jgi:hypothetical protein